MSKATRTPATIDQRFGEIGVSTGPCDRSGFHKDLLPFARNRSTQSEKASIKTQQQRTSACSIRAHSQRSLRKPVEVSTHAAADSRRLVAPKGLLDGSESMRSPAGID